jgi:hypothetical protein
MRSSLIKTSRETAATRRRLFLFPTAVKRDPAVEEWFARRGELGEIARRWFEVMRSCGPDVRELLHDGHPTACADQAAFAYVNAFTAHVNVGFFNGAELDDPTALLEGTGKFMRHVKLTPGCDSNPNILKQLIESSFSDIKRHLLINEI